MKRLFLVATFAFGLGAQTKMTAVDDAGYPRLVAAHKGKIVLVDFWATWCAPCRAEMPQLAKLDQKLRGRGFELVTVLFDEPGKEAAAAKILKDDGVSGPAFWAAYLLFGWLRQAVACMIDGARGGKSNAD